MILLVDALACYMPDLDDEWREVLDSRDLSRLAVLLTTTRTTPDSALEYVAMLHFNDGLPAGPVARALLEAGAPVDGNPEARETPLITAASYGDASVARALIEAGADINAVSAPNSGGVPSGTPLQHAAVYGMTSVLDVLVAAGARIDRFEMAAAAGNISEWPLHRFPTQTRMRALVFAADHERLEVIDQLVALGTPVNEPDAEWQRLPLHTAAGNGRTAGVRRMLTHGADPNLRDPHYHRTPLEWCVAGDRHGNSTAHAEVAAVLRPLTGDVVEG